MKLKRGRERIQKKKVKAGGEKKALANQEVSKIDEVEEKEIKKCKEKIKENATEQKKRQNKRIGHGGEGTTKRSAWKKKSKQRKRLWKECKRLKNNKGKAKKKKRVV